MIVNTVWNGKRYFLSKCPSGFNVEMDATENYGGDGKGLTPMELILVGVAGCIGIDVTMLLGKNLEKIKKMEIKTEGFRRDEMPTSFTKIETTFTIEGNISQEALLSVVDMPSMYFDQEEVDFRVFKMLKKTKPEKIRNYMNQLVKVQKTKKDTQMA